MSGLKSKWEKVVGSNRRWMDENGRIIADYSFSVGGSSIKMFMVFDSSDDFSSGNNKSTHETLRAAKKAAEIGETVDVPEELIK